MKFGIIITLYNNEKTVLKLLSTISESYLKYKLKIVIIDDCSVDNSLIKIKNSRFKNLISTIHKNNKNQGVSKSRNIGINLCNDTDYITFIDGDDYLNKDFFNFISRKNLTEDLILFDFYDVLNKKTKLIEFYKASKLITSNNLKEYIYDFLKKPNEKRLFSTCWSKLYKTKTLIKNKNYFNESLNICEDGEFLIRYLSNLKSIKYFKFPMYFHSISKGKQNLNKLTFAVKYNISHQISFLKIIKKLKYLLFKKGESYQNFKKLIFHCMGALTIIYTIRSCIRIKSFNDFLKIYNFWKKFYKLNKIRKSIYVYDYKRANGKFLIPFLIKKNLFFLSILVAYFTSLKRYKT